MVGLGVQVGVLVRVGVGFLVGVGDGTQALMITGLETICPEIKVIVIIVSINMIASREAFFMLWLIITLIYFLSIVL